MSDQNNQNGIDISINGLIETTLDGLDRAEQSVRKVVDGAGELIEGGVDLLGIVADRTVYMTDEIVDEATRAGTSLLNRLGLDSEDGGDGSDDEDGEEESEETDGLVACAVTGELVDPRRLVVPDFKMLGEGLPSEDDLFKYAFLYSPENCQGMEHTLRGEGRLKDGVEVRYHNLTQSVRVLDQLRDRAERAGEREAEAIERQQRAEERAAKAAEWDTRRQQAENPDPAKALASPRDAWVRCAMTGGDRNIFRLTYMFNPPPEVMRQMLAEQGIVLGEREPITPLQLLKYCLISRDVNEQLRAEAEQENDRRKEAAALDGSKPVLIEYRSFHAVGTLERFLQGTQRAAEATQVAERRSGLLSKFGAKVADTNPAADDGGNGGEGGGREERQQRYNRKKGGGRGGRQPGQGYTHPTEREQRQKRQRERDE